MRNEKYCYQCFRHKKKELFPEKQIMKKPKCTSCLEASKLAIERYRSDSGKKRIGHSYKQTQNRYASDNFATPEEYKIEGNHDD